VGQGGLGLTTAKQILHQMTTMIAGRSIRDLINEQKKSLQQSDEGTPHLHLKLVKQTKSWLTAKGGRENALMSLLDKLWKKPQKQMQIRAWPRKVIRSVKKIEYESKF